MSLLLLSGVSLALAAVPAGLFLANLRHYRRTPQINVLGDRSEHDASDFAGGGLSYSPSPRPSPGGRGRSRRQLVEERVSCEAREGGLQFPLSPRERAGVRASACGHSNSSSSSSDSVSVLIPARNEEASIGAAVESVLASGGVDLEVLVMDDRSEDRTAQIVGGIAARDARVRLVSGTPLPEGWCGKQFACHQLAGHATRDWLVFMDADVRLQADALARMVAFMRESGAALGSGVPRQITGTFLERLLLPLIHFVLLGFLPMERMRKTTKPGYAAGCGQLFIARRSAYEAVGGHAAVKASLHDGIQLPRAFRRAGFFTDLFDATDLATCRMYRSAAEVWGGLGKNATEGLGSPQLIGPMTLLLAGGQVLPFALLACSLVAGSAAWPIALLAALLAWLPRMVAVRRFQQSAPGALLHPLGVLLLLVIQWQALFRKLSGAPMRWKGRAYGGAVASTPRMTFARRTAAIVLGFILLSAGLVGLRGDGSRPAEAKSAPTLSSFTLADQFSTNHSIAFPRERPLVLLLADREASKVIDPWIEALIPVCEGRFDLVGVADVRGVPKLFHGRIRSGMRVAFPHPILLDWKGDVCGRLAVAKDVPSAVLLHADGTVAHRVDGAFTRERFDDFTGRLPASPGAGSD